MSRRRRPSDRGRRVYGCELCAIVAPGASRRVKRIRLWQYPSAQRDLLATHINLLVPGADLSRPFCRRCLARMERRLHWRQMVEHAGAYHYIDLQLSAYPILPTPMRMNADTRYTGRGVTIAFVDSGFYPHADLMLPRARILAIYDTLVRRKVGSIDALIRKEPQLEAWHGTMTTSAAAGSGYLSQGTYRGIASDADLVLVRTMTPDYGIHTPQVVCALKWIKRNREKYRIRIVNMSLGVDERATTLDHPVVALVEELVGLGVVVVAAAGNNSWEPIVPPAWAPSAITVGGYDDSNTTDISRRELGASSFGTSWNGAPKPELLGPSIWLAAPILPKTAVKREAEALFRMATANDSELMHLRNELATQTYIGEYLVASQSPVQVRSMVFRRIHEEKMINVNYKHVDGTSFAAPIVSSIIAQMLEARPDLSPLDIKAIVTSTAVPIPSVPREQQGFGVVHAQHALELALRMPRRETSPPVAPESTVDSTRVVS